MKRILLVVGVLVVVGVAAALWFALSRLDSLVASLIETRGSEIVGAPVRVGSVHIDLREGSGSIRGLRVGNPPGYSDADAFRLGEITLALDLGSLTSEPIVVKDLRVEAPEARFEVDARGRSNFQTLQANAARGGSGEAAPAEEGGETRRIAIRQFVFEGGKVTEDVSAVRAGSEPRSVDLPAVRLQDVGGARGGTPAQIGRTVLGAFTGAVVKTVAADEAGRALEDKIGGEAGKAAGGLLKKILD